MNLFWIAGLAVFVLLEKTLPLGQWFGRAAGVVGIVWGALLLAGA
jgi:predicted metal-binding membrane protein